MPQDRGRPDPDLDELCGRRRADSPDLINRHRRQQLSPHLAGTHIADTAILRTLLRNEVGDLGKRLCGAIPKHVGMPTQR
jgi:hypothetical protein